MTAPRSMPRTPGRRRSGRVACTAAIAALMTAAVPAGTQATGDGPSAPGTITTVVGGAGGGGSVDRSSPPDRFSDQANITWGTSVADKGDNRVGKVLAMMEAGGHVYFAGEFTGVVPPGVRAGSDEGLLPRRHLVRLDIATGELDHAWDPDPDAPVRALARSADGTRLYVGGSFNRIDGQRARNLAAFDVTTGRLDPEFRVPYLNREVRALILSPDGRRLYAGGNFTVIQEARNLPETAQDRPLLAAFDPKTGALLDWEGPENEGGQYIQKGHRTSREGTGAVYVLAITPDGSRLYAGGTFLRLGGYGGLVSIDTTTGRPTGWQPGDRGCKTGNAVCRPFYGIAVAPDDPDTVYAIGDGFGGWVASFTHGKGNKPNWDVQLDGAGMAAVATRQKVYIGGHFDCVEARGCNERRGIVRRHLAALDAKTGAVDPDWIATASTKTGPYTAYLGREHLYIGGEFNRINNRPQPGFAQFPALR